MQGRDIAVNRGDMKDFELNDFDRDTLRRYTGRDTDVIVPDCFRKIGNYAFRDNSCVETIVLYEGIREVGENAFCGCRSLKEICLSFSILHIGSSAFENCRNLRGIILPPELTAIENSTYTQPR